MVREKKLNAISLSALFSRVLKDVMRGDVWRPSNGLGELRRGIGVEKRKKAFLYFNIILFLINQKIM